MITIGSDLEVGPSDAAPELRVLLGLTSPRRPRRTRLFRLG